MTEERDLCEMVSWRKTQIKLEDEEINDNEYFDDDEPEYEDEVDDDNIEEELDDDDYEDYCDDEYEVEYDEDD